MLSNMCNGITLLQHVRDMEGKAIPVRVRHCSLVIFLFLYMQMSSRPMDEVGGYERPKDI